MLGGQIARRLLARDERVRILVRDGSEFGPLVAMGAEPSMGDLKDGASLVRACRGVDTIVTTAISIGRGGADTVDAVEDAGYASLIEAAREAGVRHVVYTSMLDADRASPVPFVAAKATTEQRLIESGLAWTILSPGPFMDVWLAAVVAGPALEGREVVYVGGGRTPHSFVHSRDVAAFACAAVSNRAAENRRFLIGGPEALSLRDAIAVLEGVLGRDIPHRGVGFGERVPGLPPAMAGMLGMLEMPETIVDARELAHEFGVDQTSVRQWAESMLAVPAG